MNEIEVADERKGLPSASNWRRYELCPGSHQLSLQAYKLSQEASQQPSQASDRGERIHTALADQVAELSGSETTTFEFLAQRADDQVKRIFGDSAVTVLKEQRLWFRLGGKEVASGQFDRAIHNHKLALIIDFKTGWAEPDPAEINAQLKFLAVLVALRWPVQEVIAQLISGPFGVSEVRFGLTELEHNYNDIIATLRKLNDPHAPFNPSPEACRYCPALMICDATKKLIEPISRLQYSELPNGDRAAKLLDEVEILSRQLEQIRDYYKGLFLSDDTYRIPGYALEQGAPRRTVGDWPAAIAKLGEFIDEKDIDSVAQYSIPTLERLLGKAIGVKGPKLREQFKFILGDLLAEKYPSPSLKRVKGEPKLATLADV